MKVILQQNVQKLGNAGDVVEAASGYFRNFLQPRGLAVPATPGTLKKREEDLSALKRKAEQAHQANVDLGERINALGTVTLTAKAGEGGKLYGKVTNKEIAQALHKELGVEIDKRLVKPQEEIGALGSYRVQVKLSADVHSEFSVEVRSVGAVEKAESNAEETPEAE